MVQAPRPLGSVRGDDGPADARLTEPASPQGHVVGFYESEQFLVDSVVRFLAPALGAGDSAVLVETRQHREQVETALLAAGIDVAGAARGGRLLAVDADELLATFMVGGSPDPGRFTARVGELIAHVAAAGRPVRVHGEMVALLWDRGHVTAALGLEDLWNELLATHACTLLCTYPMGVFDDEAVSEAFRTVCQQHDTVVPCESYSQLADEDARRRTVAVLQHEATVGITGRTTLRQRQHELEDELWRSRELSRLRDELIATMRDGVQAAVADSSDARRRSVDTFTTTALRAVRRALHADCAFEPADSAFEPAESVTGGGELEDAQTGMAPPEAIAAPVASETRHGLLRVRLADARAATREDRAFVDAVAQLLASAIDHDDAQRRLCHQALGDPLTGLPTRTLLRDRLHQALRRSGRAGGRVAVLFIDLDSFKPINDRFGHAVGDRLLALAAGRLRDTLRPADTLARVGGDEFAVVCEDVDDEDGALTVGERLREAVCCPLSVDGAQIAVSASIGVVLGEPGHDADVLMHHADTAMYEAKRAGRNRSELVEAGRRQPTIGALAFDTALSQALERGELRVGYQPQVDLHTGRVLAVEALVRWQHPARGLVTADEFLPAARLAGLAVAFDRWVLHAACAQAAGWLAAGAAAAVAVNVSADHLISPDVVDTVARALHDSGLAPQQLRLEVDEEAVMWVGDRARDALLGLSELGVALTVDGFGAGSWSLGRLESLPVDALELDRSLIEGVAADPRSQRLVAAAVQLAHTLGRSVAAEGVEHPQQEAELRRLGCDRGQGHHWSRPLDAARLHAFLTRSR